jgi:hypothetical protein
MQDSMFNSRFASLAGFPNVGDELEIAVVTVSYQYSISAYVVTHPEYCKLTSVSILSLVKFKDGL